MPGNTCGHGKTWDEPCLECEVISLRASIESLEPILIRKKERLIRIEQEIKDNMRKALSEIKQ